MMDRLFVCSAKAMRNEPLDERPNRFLSTATEYLLSSSIEQQDSLFAVDRNDRIHCRADDKCYFFFTGARFLFDLPALGDVRNHREHARFVINFNEFCRAQGPSRLAIPA